MSNKSTTPMLYNVDLTRKLKYGALALSVFFIGYLFLTYIDQTIHSTRLYLAGCGILLTILSVSLMKKANLLLVLLYSVGILAIASGLLFRVRVNIPMDVLLFGIAVGIGVGFGSQLKKKNEFA